MGCHTDPDLRQDAHRPLPARGRAAQAQSHCHLDGEVDAEPGLKTRALCIIALAELVERGFIEVIVTTFSPRRYDPHWPRGDREALARGGVALLAGTHRIPGFVSLGTSTPMCPRGT